MFLKYVSPVFPKKKKVGKKRLTFLNKAHPPKRNKPTVCHPVIFHNTNTLQHFNTNKTTASPTSRCPFLTVSKLNGNFVAEKKLHGSSSATRTGQATATANKVMGDEFPTPSVQAGHQGKRGCGFFGRNREGWMGW